MKKGADFSQDGNYRYSLHRIWDESKPLAMCIGLNPSTANAEKDDPTIGNLIEILTNLNYGGFYMMNCWAYIASKPENLKINPMSEKWNENLMTVIAHKCKDVIFAWGNFKIVREQGKDEELSEMFPRAKCFGKNLNGTPLHPRALTYIKGALKSPRLIQYAA